MSENVLQQIAALVQAQRFDDAIALCRDALSRENAPKRRVNIATALCLALGGSGRVAEAGAAYDEFRDLLRGVGGDFHLPAAVAAQRTDDITAHFRKGSSAYAGQPIRYSELMGVGDWSARQGLAPIEIDPPQHIVLPNAEGYTTDPYTCFKVPSAEMISGWDFVFAPTGQLLSDTGYVPLATHFGVFPYAIAKHIRQIAHVWPEACEDVPHEALFLSTPRAFHVGHFLVDFLPRLRCLAKFPAALKIAFPREAPGKFVDLLAQFGIPKERMFFCDLGRRYRFASLVVAKHGDYLKPNPATVSFVRRALHKPPARPPGRRIFLERDIGTRQIANREEFDALLAEMDVARVNLAHMTIAEQQAAFSEAKVMIGVFGSDLLCAYFAPSGAHMIELTWDPTQASVIAPTCPLVGVRHQYQVCAEAPVSRLKRVGKDRDVIVDCAALRARLAKIV